MWIMFLFRILDYKINGRCLCCSLFGQSDCMYNAGWTEDIRKIVDHLHCQYPEAPLFAVGTSIGANVLV